MNQIWSLPGQYIIHEPATSNLALSSLRSRLKTNKGDYVTCISVEDLFIRGIGRSANLAFFGGGGEIFNMRKN